MFSTSVFQTNHNGLPPKNHYSPPSPGPRFVHPSVSPPSLPFSYTTPLNPLRLRTSTAVSLSMCCASSSHQAELDRLACRGSEGTPIEPGPSRIVPRYIHHGDWLCCKCKAHNFKSRVSCFEYATLVSESRVFYEEGS